MRRFLNEKWQKIVKACGFLLVGLAFIFIPGTALAVTLRIIGALLLVYQVLEIYEIYRANKNSMMLALFLMNEIFLALLALMLVINPLGAVKTLALVVGIYFLIIGAIGLYRTIGVRDTRGIVINAISTLVGFLLLVLPYLFQSVITIILGVALIIKGVNLLLPLINNNNNNNNKDTYYM